MAEAAGLCAVGLMLVRSEVPSAKIASTFFLCSHLGAGALTMERAKGTYVNACERWTTTGEVAARQHRQRDASRCARRILAGGP